MSHETGVPPTVHDVVQEVGAVVVLPFGTTLTIEKPAPHAPVQPLTISPAEQASVALLPPRLTQAWGTFPPATFMVTAPL